MLLPGAGTIFPTASDVPQGGDSGQEENSQRHQPKQNVQIITTVPEFGFTPSSSSPPPQADREGDEAEELHAEIHYGRMIKISSL